MPDFDLLVVGGGPIGATTALALRESGLGLAIVEPIAPRTPSSDPRPIALSHGSRLILERLGVWERLMPTATPIERIHVSQSGGFGRVELDATQTRLPALGYVVDYAGLATLLRQELLERVQSQRCHWIQAKATAIESSEDGARVHYESASGAGEASASLIAVAEGGALAGAATRTRDYRQCVVTTRVIATLPNRNVAYERFTPEGPLALLPMGEGFAVVWTTTPERALELCEATESHFLHRLQAAFGGRVGDFRQAGARAQFPLSLRVAAHSPQPRLVALGNAAQTLHPVAGQGLNLGLRDAWELAETARPYRGADIGGPAHLRAYRARRRLDRAGGIAFTEGLVRLFSNEIAALRLARGVGLAMLGVLPPARDFLVRRMIFGTRG